MGDLHHAIQAAAKALYAAEMGQMLRDPSWHTAARIAVEAAAPHLAANLQRRLDQLQRVADAAGVLWHSQNAWAPTPEKIRRQEWTVVEVGRDAMADLGDALDLAAPATPEVGDG